MYTALSEIIFLKTVLSSSKWINKKCRPIIGFFSAVRENLYGILNLFKISCLNYTDCNFDKFRIDIDWGYDEKWDVLVVGWDCWDV